VEKENGMKSYRFTLVFLCITALLGGYAYWDYSRTGAMEEKKQAALNLFKIKPETVVRAEINAKNYKIVLEKKADQWQLLEPLVDSGDTPSIFTFLTTVTGEKSLETVTEGTDIKWDVYGLDKPVTSLALKASDGTSSSIKIGSVKAYDANLYARVGDENRVFLVGSSWDVHLSKTAREFRDKRLMRLDPIQPFDSLEIKTTAPLSQVSLVKPAGGSWKFKDDSFAKHAFPVSGPAVESYIDQMKTLRALDFADDDKSAPGVLEKRGLKTPAVEVKMQSLASIGQTVYDVAFSAPHASDPNVFAISSEVKPVLSVFKTAASSAISLKKAEDFFDKKSPFQFKVTDVAKINIQTKDVTTTIEKRGTDWVQTSDQVKAEPGKVDAFLTHLSQLEAVRFLPPTPSSKATSQKSAGAAKIILSSAGGKTLYELNWADLVTENASKKPGDAAKSSSPEHRDEYGDVTPQAQYHPAHVVLAEPCLACSEWTVGIPAASITQLEISGIFKKAGAAAQPTPAPAASPALKK
jgi:hypothetical protein